MVFPVELLPALATQFLAGWAMLALFQQSADEVHPLRAPATALFCLLAGLGIEVFLSPFLFQGTLVVQWALFVMLGHRVCRVPLGKSMLAQFCFFSLMLGKGLLEERVGGSDLGMEERRLLEGEPSGETDEVPDGRDHLEASLLHHRLLAVRHDVHGLLYDLPGPAAPVPTPKPPPPVDPPSEPPGMSGAAFEALIYGDAPEPPDPVVESTAFAPDDPASTPPPEIIPVEFPEAPALTGDSTSIHSDQMSEIVEVKNRSTDATYAPPTFEIGAISIGANGRFAMIDGRLLREGAVLRTGAQDPRGWKLYQVTKTELFWQPLK